MIALATSALLQAGAAGTIWLTWAAAALGATVVAVRIRLSRAGTKDARIRAPAPPPTEQHGVLRASEWVEWFAWWLALCAAAAAGWLSSLGGELPGALRVAAAVLFAVPAFAFERTVRDIFADGIHALAQLGIRVPSAAILERAAHIRIAAIQPEAVLTEGLPEVQRVVAMPGQSERHVLELAAGAESQLSSGTARAICRHAAEHGLTPAPMHSAHYSTGRGVSAEGESGAPVLVGHRRLLLEALVSAAAAEGAIPQAAERGNSLLFVASHGRLVGCIELRDPLKADARSVVQRLLDIDIDVVILSGDHRASLEAVARKLDINNIRAEQDTAERVAEISRLRGADALVAVVACSDDPVEWQSAGDLTVLLGALRHPIAARAFVCEPPRVTAISDALPAARATADAAARGLVTTCAIGLLGVLAAFFGFIGPVTALAGSALADVAAFAIGRRLRRRLGGSIGGLGSSGDGCAGLML